MDQPREPSDEVLAKIVDGVIVGLRTLYALSTTLHQPGDGALDDDAEEEQQTTGLRSVNPAWRTYDRFRYDMQRREQSAREADQTRGIVQPISKDRLAGQTGGDSRRTINRRMKHFHLDPDRDWPPSTWPAEEPDGRQGHPLVGGLAASYLGWAILDLVSDGRLDNIVRAIKFIGCLHGRV